MAKKENLLGMIRARTTKEFDHDAIEELLKSTGLIPENAHIEFTKRERSGAKNDSYEEPIIRAVWEA